MKQRFLCIATAFCIVISSILCSCTPEKQKTKYTDYSMDYFDTVITITGYEYSRENFDVVSEEIFSMLKEYHQLYSIYHRFEGVKNLCDVNELVNGVHPTVTVDRRIIDMLLYAKEMYTLTNGVMNIAMGSVLSLWHDYRTIGKNNPDEASLPPMDSLKTAANHTDISNMVIDEANCTVTLTDPQMKLDVGAVAKGYATEQVALYLEKKGVTGYVLNVGGNVRTIGTKPDGTKWNVGIENPDGAEHLAYLKLSGESVVTSGSYQRFYYVEGKAYHHIIDPDTLMPAKGYLSVSVVCNNSGLGDALSTALFCLSKEDGIKLIEKVPEAEAMWVTDEGEKFYSSGFEKYK